MTGRCLHSARAFFRISNVLVFTSFSFVISVGGYVSDAQWLVMSRTRAHGMAWHGKRRRLYHDDTLLTLTYYLHTYIRNLYSSV
jgi:hypothetical protein